MLGRIHVGQDRGTHVLRCHGEVRVHICAALDRYCEKMLDDPQFHAVVLDLREATTVDSTALGSFAKLSIAAQAKHDSLPILICTSGNILRILQAMGFDDVFTIISKQVALDNSQVFNPEMNTSELMNAPDQDEPQALERVIAAHRVLMSLNEKNKLEFEGLVSALESEARSDDNAGTTGDAKKAG